jgi:hypothetical protein
MVGTLAIVLILMLATSIHAFTRHTFLCRTGASALRMASSLPTNEDGWRTKLSANQFAVLRKQATEPSGFSENTPGELEYELKKKLGLLHTVKCGPRFPVHNHLSSVRQPPRFH